MARLTAPHSLLLASFIAAIAVAAAVPGRAPAADAPAAPVSRGEYLTHGAGQCEDCHGAGLAGAPMAPGPPGVPWAKEAPSLRGLPMFANDADAIAFLETANLPNGRHALPPMPHYNFNAADATAIVAYLRALK